jgi:hypothetical protein
MKNPSCNPGNAYAIFGDYNQAGVTNTQKVTFYFE